MRILLSCQFSTRLRDGFRAAGHDAWSNDVLPHWFAGTTSKRTGLRLINLPPLVRKQWIAKEHITYDIHKEPPGVERSHKRSKTFPGIADAMVENWSNL